MKAKHPLSIAALIIVFFELGSILYFLSFAGQLDWQNPELKTAFLILAFTSSALLILSLCLIWSLIRKEADQARITEQLKKLDKLASIGFLTSGIAHEINNPVNFVTSNIFSLIRDVQDIISVVEKYSKIHIGKSIAEEITAIREYIEEIDLNYTIEETHQLLQGIQEGAKRISVIIKDLRTFSRTDEGVMAKSNIEEGLDSTLNLLYNQVKNRIKIIKEYGSVPEIYCYPGKLNQVFMNLLVNALHAIHDTGEIRIKTEQLNGRVVIKIKDTGSGIKKEVLPHIFEPFFTTKKAGEGTGLGLTLSRSIILEQHGDIQVSSQEGVGTEFVISLPLIE
ncbi:MAG: GHKL domain-containing protein [Candidatus Protochlamydia sp.]|nr:GHKL domain-containing protein [Candidatus Protochlamydia sp.]